jgi:hypothetical protein
MQHMQLNRPQQALSDSLAYIFHTTKRSTLALVKPDKIEFYQLTPNVAHLLAVPNRYTTERVANDVQLTLKRNVASTAAHLQLLRQVYQPLNRIYTHRYMHICRLLSAELCPA